MSAIESFMRLDISESSRPLSLTVFVNRQKRYLKAVLFKLFQGVKYCVMLKRT